MEQMDTGQAVLPLLVSFGTFATMVTWAATALRLMTTTVCAQLSLSQNLSSPNGGTSINIPVEYLYERRAMNKV